MPGHTRSWGLGYDITVSCPDYIRRSPYRNNIGMHPGKPLLYNVIEGVIKEATINFPDQFYHFGADEVRKDCWAEDKTLAEFMRRMNFENFDQVLAYFETKLEVIYRKYGKKMIAWQELLLEQKEFNVPKDVIIHTWKEQKDLADVVRKGHQTLLSAGWYLDFQIPPGGQRRLLWVQNWMDYYLNEPFKGQNFNETEKKLVLGGWGCAWGEVIDNLVYEERIWPRTSAIAERLWSPMQINQLKPATKRLADFRCNTLVRRGVKATPIQPSYCKYNYDFGDEE
jgi:hexosaminidase